MTPNHHFCRVVPWRSDEFMLVDGFRVVYRHDEELGLIVQLPGGRAATVEELRAEGRTVVMPTNMRFTQAIAA